MATFRALAGAITQMIDCRSVRVGSQILDRTTLPRIASLWRPPWPEYDTPPMTTSVKIWDGNEWQRYIVRLLKMRYPLGDFQEVPDRHRGDFGIEGFSRDGRAYQCYAAVEPLSTAARYDSHRDKIAQDIKKFIDNKHELAKLFGPTKISRWLLAVPLFDSGPLVQYAEKKAVEVRALNLPYVTSDFCTSIITDDDFEKERAQLVRLGLQHVSVMPRPLDSSRTTEWSASNSILLQALHNKLEGLSAFPPERRASLRANLLKHYLQGQDILTTLKNSHSEVFEAAINAKAAREAYLETGCLMSDMEPQQLLLKALEDFKRELLKFGVMTEQMAEALAYEALADWLMRCPLSFPGKIL